jgi:tRNA threonylcarbamoyladenosine modification (KEOPS) complex  Pcc1 subunit
MLDERRSSVTFDRARQRHNIEIQSDDHAGLELPSHVGDGRKADFV